MYVLFHPYATPYSRQSLPESRPAAPTLQLKNHCKKSHMKYQVLRFASCLGPSFRLSDVTALLEAEQLLAVVTANAADSQPAPLPVGSCAARAAAAAPSGSSGSSGSGSRSAMAAQSDHRAGSFHLPSNHHHFHGSLHHNASMMHHMNRSSSSAGGNIGGGDGGFFGGSFGGSFGGGGARWSTVSLHPWLGRQGSSAVTGISGEPLHGPQPNEEPPSPSTFAGGPSISGVAHAIFGHQSSHGESGGQHGATAASGTSSLPSVATSLSSSHAPGVLFNAPSPSHFRTEQAPVTSWAHSASSGSSGSGGRGSGGGLHHRRFTVNSFTFGLGSGRESGSSVRSSAMSSDGLAAIPQHQYSPPLAVSESSAWRTPACLAALSVAGPRSASNANHASGSSEAPTASSFAAVATTTVPTAPAAATAAAAAAAAAAATVPPVAAAAVAGGEDAPEPLAEFPEEAAPGDGSEDGSAVALPAPTDTALGDQAVSVPVAGFSAGAPERQWLHPPKEALHGPCAPLTPALALSLERPQSVAALAVGAPAAHVGPASTSLASAGAVARVAASGVACETPSVAAAPKKGASAKVFLAAAVEGSAAPGKGAGPASSAAATATASAATMDAVAAAAAAQASPLGAPAPAPALAAPITFHRDQIVRIVKERSSLFGSRAVVVDPSAGPNGDRVMVVLLAQGHGTIGAAVERSYMPQV